MIEVVPYIQTIGTDKFKDFLSVKFTMDMLYPIYNDKSTDTLFEGWRGKDMINWYRFTNDENYILEFYPNNLLNVKKNTGISYQIILPKTLNDFINTMNMFGIKLYWTNWIDINFEPKDYLNKDKIKDYYVNLLNKIDKSFELI